MEKKYKHLNWDQRLVIERALRKGYTPQQISELIGCCRATVYNEIKRGEYIHHSGPFWVAETRYSPELAQEKYDNMLKNKGVKKKIEADPELAAFIENKIVNEKFSPASTLAYIKKEFPNNFLITINSVTTLYSYIKDGVFAGLTMKNCPYRKKHHHKKKAMNRPKKLPKIGKTIDDRPSEVENRDIFGHWEMDTVKGKAVNRKCLLVLTERKTRYEIVEVMKSCTSAETVKALNRIEKKFKSKFFNVFKSITCDNGNEFADYEGIEKALYRVGNRTALYYCHPYRSSERGSNENQNKFIRRFYPKGSNFDKTIQKSDVKTMERWINDYPRKILDWKNPMELFLKELALI